MALYGCHLTFSLSGLCQVLPETPAAGADFFQQNIGQVITLGLIASDTNTSAYPARQKRNGSTPCHC